ncbi:MAG: hypothetical protein HOO99_03900 [Hyphomicrobiaceae bacterium]|nr:hypothetical protein [Hyphomicrobiaceae bacterium]
MNENTPDTTATPTWYGPIVAVLTAWLQPLFDGGREAIAALSPATKLVSSLAVTGSAITAVLWFGVLNMTAPTAPPPAYATKAEVRDEITSATSSTVTQIDAIITEREEGQKAELRATIAELKARIDALETKPPAKPKKK